MPAALTCPEHLQLQSSHEQHHTRQERQHTAHSICGKRKGKRQLPLTRTRGKQKRRQQFGGKSGDLRPVSTTSGSIRFKATVATAVFAVAPRFGNFAFRTGARFSRQRVGELTSNNTPTTTQSHFKGSNATRVHTGSRQIRQRFPEDERQGQGTAQATRVKVLRHEAK